MSKKISVALCTYNGQKFLTSQFQSIFDQSLPVDEVIVCDDCSTDETISIVHQYIEKYPGKIKLFINETNLRSVRNFEKAISLTTGDYIFLSDQDDLWHVDKVKKIIGFFEANPKAEGVFTNASLINDDGKEFCDYSLWHLAMFSYDMIKKYGGFWKVYQIHQNMVTGATFCFTKNVKDLIFPFPITRFFHHDEWIALHLAQRQSLFCLQDHLTLYRIHTDQQVGDLMLQRYEKERKFSDWALGLKEPRSFGEYFKSYKRAFLIHMKFTDLKKTAGNTPLNIDELLKGSIENINDIDRRMKKKYPVFYTVKRTIDKIRNKRQIPKI